MLLLQLFNNTSFIFYLLGYWVIIWLTPAVILLYIPVIKIDASVVLKYYEFFSLPSLLVPLALIVFVLKAPLKAKINLIILGIVAPAAILIFWLVNQVKLGFGGF